MRLNIYGKNDCHLTSRISQWDPGQVQVCLGGPNAAYGSCPVRASPAISNHLGHHRRRRMPTDLQASTMLHFIIQVEPVLTIARPKQSASKIGQSRRSAAPAPTEWSGDGPRHRRIGMTVGAMMGFCWARASCWLVSEIAPDKDAATPGLCAMLTGLRNPYLAGPLPTLPRPRRRVAEQRWPVHPGPAYLGADEAAIERIPFL